MQNATMRPPKSKRLVSVWTVIPDADVLMQRLKPFADLFDQVVLMCGLPGDDHGYVLDAHKKIVKELHAMEISVLNDHGGRADLFENTESFDQHIREMLSLCDESGADGIDIDFEGWPSTSRYVYEDVMTELSVALHKQGKQLSVCAFPTNVAQRRECGIGFIDPSTIGALVDHYRVMNYDLFCPPSEFIGPTSTAPWGRENVKALLQTVPNHKLILGLPTYSVDWNINNPAKSRQVNDVEFIEEKEKLSPIGRGWVYFWDVGLIRYTDENGDAHLLYVSDAKSTRSHLETVSANDLAGVCFWVFNEVVDTGIFEAVRECFRR